MDKIRTVWQLEFFNAPNEIYDRRDISGYVNPGAMRIQRNGKSFASWFKKLLVSPLIN